MARKKGATHCRRGHELATQRLLPDGACRLCRRENSRKHYAASQKRRDDNRRRVRKWQGLADAVGERRAGPCEACGAPADPLHLDHDHNTGARRGWLCGPCNRALGLLQDSEERCQQLAGYRRRFGAYGL